MARKESKPRANVVAGGVVVAMLIGVLFAPSAIAQTPTDDQYGTEAANVQQLTAGNGPGTASAGGSSATSPASPLPFTGLDVGIILAVGFMLLVSGFVLRRAVRDRTYDY
jgi:hypothetical protein